MIVSDIDIDEEELKLMKDIIKRQKLYNFLKDKTNKSAIVILLTLFIYFLLCKIVHNLVVRIVSYFVVYYILSYFYDKTMNYLFRDFCK